MSLSNSKSSTGSVSWREATIMTMSQPNYSTPAKFYSLFMAVCISAAILQLILTSFATLMRDEAWRRGLFVLDTVVSVIFTIDYFIRFALSYDHLAFVLDLFNIVDLLSFLPYYIEIGLSATNTGVSTLKVLRVLRILRLIRIFKLSRNMQMLQMLFAALAEARRSIFILYFIVLLFAVISGSIMYFVETAFCTYSESEGAWVYKPGVIYDEDNVATSFQNIMDGIYWAIVTITTVGYGDYVPISWAGRFVGSIALISAVAVIALPITLVGGVFSRHYDMMKANNPQGGISLSSFKVKKFMAQQVNEDEVAEEEEVLTWENLSHRTKGNVGEMLTSIINRMERQQELVQENEKQLLQIQSDTKRIVTDLQD